MSLCAERNTLEVEKEPWRDSRSFVLPLSFASAHCAFAFQVAELVRCVAVKFLAFISLLATGGRIAPWPRCCPTHYYTLCLFIILYSDVEPLFMVECLYSISEVQHAHRVQHLAGMSSTHTHITHIATHLHKSMLEKVLLYIRVLVF